MQYRNARDLIEGELPRMVRGQLLPVFRRGLKAYDDILNMPGGTFHSVFIHNLKGWLLNFLIFRQFEADMLSASFPFVPEPIKVNTFKYTALNLQHNNIRINVGKAFDGNAFPNNSKYRRNYSHRNLFPDDDIFSGSTPAYDRLFDSEEPYFIFLTFNVKNEQLDFLNLMVPNWNMKTCLAKVELKQELALYKTEPVEEKNDEKIVATLKNNVVHNLPLKGEGNE